MRLIAAVLLLTQAAALSFTQTYKNGPVPLDSSANLSFTIDLSARTASFGLRVSGEVLSQTWVGIGISEPNSGSMLGADIATAEFTPNSTDECKLTDRHVPFAAYPLLSAAGGARPVFPVEDDCQGGWTLVSCARDAENGFIVLEVSRGLDAEEPQDRDIVPGLNNVIYAYGSAFRYHVGNRASARVTLYDGPKGASEPPLPADIEDNFTITATNYPVSDEKVTVYACTSARIPVKKGQKRMIIAAEPILNATVTDRIHHLTLYLCRGAEYAKLIEKTVECTTGDKIPGPVGNPFAACMTFVYGYAKGTIRFALPPEVGFVVDEENNYLAMETHYDNPDLESGNFDSSGVRVFLTDTMREHEAGSLLTGDLLVSLMGQKVKSEFEYELTCTTACTERFSEPVNLFSSFLHMHRTGKKIYTNRFNKRNKFVENVNKVDFWSDNFQNMIAIDKKLNPGDQLQLTCLYDTRKLPNTTFGLQTVNEMCVDLLGYWPVQRDPVTNDPINICSFGLSNGTSVTFCGNFGREYELGTSILLEQNPAFEDRRGAPTDFGQAPDVCPVATDEAVGPESPAPSDGEVLPVPGIGTSPADGEPVETDGAPVATDGEPSEEAPPVEDEDVCFPSWASVTTRDGPKRMDELEVGEEVLISSGKYSPVFMFTHKDRDTRYAFLTLSTGNHSITLTRGHYLYVNDALVRAEIVRVGDRLRLADGGLAEVKGVRMGWERGLYNPQTLHGDVVVGGIVASCYTVRVLPWRAHALLTPLRWAFGIVGMDASRIVVS